jgi:hypothetical protein
MQVRRADNRYDVSIFDIFGSFKNVQDNDDTWHKKVIHCRPSNAAYR